MQTTVEFLTEIKARHQLQTDGRLSVKLDLTRSAISKLMAGRDFMGDDTAIKVAELLDLDPAYVMACAHAERAARAKNDTALKIWERIAANMHYATAALLVLAIGAAPFLPWDNSLGLALAGVVERQGVMYIMSNPAWVSLALILAVATLALWAFPRHQPPQPPR